MIRIALVLMFLASATMAQERPPSHCLAVADNVPGMAYLHQATFRDPVGESTVRVRYISHASFLLQTHGGLSAVTDFTGFLGNVEFLPDIVTMNHAHGTHFTAHPDPAIPHVLPGWGAFGQGITHHLDLGEMLVRNISTDIRSEAGVEPKGNSIFVFEVAGLCIGHLGHLHHEPSPEQYAAIGRLDVVMAAVDGGVTLDLQTMLKVMRRFKARIVIPMHWFADGSLGRFLTGMEDEFDIVETGGSDLTVSLEHLPTRPTVMVLWPSYLREDE
ncbi:MBL fold metallo-hydrolase [uncultured Roseovarius sp.]|uniref:MBL fold metallo-hydrolase n=1 Tax=uncultured Roseovarius sp. TaxID=293344 RepID=UPI00261296D4|nr:MBL fold metallo-hydrolase [uncultured Roseovarius sp.]